MNAPVLTSSTSAMEEITGRNALYFNPEDFNDIADKMMMIYKDEDKRNQLIEKGKEIAANYSWKKSADLLWKAVLEAANKNSH